MRYLAYLLFAVFLLSCKKEDPKPKEEVKYYDVRLSSLASIYPIAIYASFGDTLNFNDTAYSEYDTTFLSVPSKTKVYIRAYNYIPHNEFNPMKVGIYYSHWDGLATLYTKDTIVSTTLVLP